MKKKKKIIPVSSHYLNPTDAAQYIGVSRTTIYRWHNAGKIDSSMGISGQRIFLIKDLNHLKKGMGK